jgi:hypothetical protein
MAPSPEPLAPLVMVIQLTELVAVQEQLVPVVIERADVLPMEGTETLVGVTEYEQLPTPCVNVTVTPATVAVPTRVPGSGFAATA